MKPIRHGDVVLTPIKTLPAKLEQVARKNGRLVLAEGEVTGHAHAIVDEQCELVTADQAAELYLLVHGTEPVELTHEEHHTVLLPALPNGYQGWQVTQLREYTPELIRPVRD